MNIDRIKPSDWNSSADALIVGVLAKGALPGPTAEVDKALGGAIARLIKAGEIAGKACEVTTLLAPRGLKAQQVAVVGLGEKKELDRGVAFRAAGAAANRLAAKPRKKVVLHLPLPGGKGLLESAVVGAVVGCHGQDDYRKDKNRHPFDSLLVAGNSAEVKSGRLLGEAVNLTRHVVNQPPQELYPESFAQQAAETAEQCGLEIEVWDQDRLEAERAGSLLAVAKGSSRPPRLVILRYSGADRRKPTLALVGKGVTFDSGGLSLKSNESMKTMKCDMAGAGTVLGAMKAIADLQLEANVIGLMGLVENMPGPAAVKLGDVLTARNGKTIEVLNTDAEGRLVLADVLTVAVERGAAKIIDLATLTGSCVVALGMDVAGLMANDQAWCDAVSSAAKTCGEPAWQLPMFDCFREEIQSNVADIKNVGADRWGGAMRAAKFLEEFVDNKPWTHIDIAGPAFLEKSKPWNDGGASGAFVRTLVEVAREW